MLVVCSDIIFVVLGLMYVYKNILNLNVYFYAFHSYIVPSFGTKFNLHQMHNKFT